MTTSGDEHDVVVVGGRIAGSSLRPTSLLAA